MNVDLFCHALLAFQRQIIWRRRHVRMFPEYDRRQRIGIHFVWFFTEWTLTVFMFLTMLTSVSLTSTYFLGVTSYLTYVYAVALINCMDVFSILSSQTKVIIQLETHGYICFITCLCVVMRCTIYKRANRPASVCLLSGNIFIVSECLSIVSRCNIVW